MYKWTIHVTSVALIGLAFDLSERHEYLHGRTFDYGHEFVLKGSSIKDCAVSRSRMQAPVWVPVKCTARCVVCEKPSEGLNALVVGLYSKRSKQRPS